MRDARAERGSSESVRQRAGGTDGAGRGAENGGRSSTFDQVAQWWWNARKHGPESAIDTTHQRLMDGNFPLTRLANVTMPDSKAMASRDFGSGDPRSCGLLEGAITAALSLQAERDDENGEQVLKTASRPSWNICSPASAGEPTGICPLRFVYAITEGRIVEFIRLNCAPLRRK